MGQIKKTFAIGSAIIAGPLLAATVTWLGDEQSGDGSEGVPIIVTGQPPVWTGGGGTGGGGSGPGSCQPVNGTHPTFNCTPTGGGGGGSSPPPTPPPFACRTISRNGNNITIQGTIAVAYGDYNLVGPPGQNIPRPGIVDAADAQTIVGQINSTWSRQLGMYNVQVNLVLTQGPAQFHVWIGNPGAAARSWPETGDIWLSPPIWNRNPRTVPHEFGHLIGNFTMNGAHPNQLPGYVYSGGDLMNWNADGPPLQRHIEAALRACGLANQTGA